LGYCRAILKYPTALDVCVIVVILIIYWQVTM
jgi:hypothetical protein